MERDWVAYGPLGGATLLGDSVMCLAALSKTADEPRRSDGAENQDERRQAKTGGETSKFAWGSASPQNSESAKQERISP